MTLYDRLSAEARAQGWELPKAASLLTSTTWGPLIEEGLACGWRANGVWVIAFCYPNLDVVMVAASRRLRTEMPDRGDIFYSNSEEEKIGIDSCALAAVRRLRELLESK